MRTILTEDLSDLWDGRSVADEGGKDHVDALLHPKPQVTLVFLTDSRQVDWHSWQVYSLSAAQHAAILHCTHQVTGTCMHTVTVIDRGFIRYEKIYYTLLEGTTEKLRVWKKVLANIWFWVLFLNRPMFFILGLCEYLKCQIVSNQIVDFFQTYYVTFCKEKNTQAVSLKWLSNV